MNPPRFTRPAQVLEHWATPGNVELSRVWAQPPTLDNAHRAVTPTPERNAQARLWRESAPPHLEPRRCTLSSQGRFLIGRSAGTAKFYIYHAHSGLILNDHNGFAARYRAEEWAEGLEHATGTDGHLYDWSTRQLADRLGLHLDRSTIEDLAARGQAGTGDTNGQTLPDSPVLHGVPGPEPATAGKTTPGPPPPAATGLGTARGTAGTVR